MVDGSIYGSIMFLIIKDRITVEIHMACALEEEQMAISVQVPKDLSGIKTKVALNLTRRQIICFGGAAITGVPLYFLTKGVIGTTAASLIMMIVMLPFFFFAMYEKNGFPAEKLLYFMIQQKLLTPGIRPYHSENIHTRLEENAKLREEVRYLEEKAKGRA
jgi:hypothetical protein